MKVLITGGAGFLGLRLAKKICARGSLVGPQGTPEAIEQVILFDRVQASPQGLDARIVSAVGDIADARDVDSVFQSGIDSVFHLAAVVSGQAEQDFDLGMRVNVDASRTLLEAARQSGRRPRVLFSSSVAVYGGLLPPLVQDDTALNPQSSYGVQKAIGELLLFDYSRKGFVDGRVARLPTIAVRPGKPNQAASSFVSSVIREPLNGERAVCPVHPETPLWISSPEAAIDNLVVLHEAGAEALGPSRNVNLPGLSVTAQEMIDALRAGHGDAIADKVDWVFEDRIQKIVGTWPRAWDTGRASRLGMTADRDVADLIRQYANEIGA